MMEIFLLLSKYFLQIQKFRDPPGYKEERQTVVDETQVNEAFDPANDALSGLREVGDWVIDFVSDTFNQLFGNLMWNHVKKHDSSARWWSGKEVTGNSSKTHQGISKVNKLL